MSNSCNPIDCSLPASSVHGTFQARVLEWVAIPFSRGSFPPRYWTQVSCIEADSLLNELRGKPYDLMDVGNLICGSSAFSKSSLNIWKFTVHVLLKPGLEDFEHDLASMWNECNCAVVWIFFGIAFFGFGMKTGLSSVVYQSECEVSWSGVLVQVHVLAHVRLPMYMMAPSYFQSPRGVWSEKMKSATGSVYRFSVLWSKESRSHWNSVHCTKTENQKQEFSKASLCTCIILPMCWPPCETGIIRSSSGWEVSGREIVKMVFLEKSLVLSSRPLLPWVVVWPTVAPFPTPSIL